MPAISRTGVRQRRTSNLTPRSSATERRRSSSRIRRSLNCSTCNHSATMMGDVEPTRSTTIIRRPENASSAPDPVPLRTVDSSNNSTRTSVRRTRSSGRLTRSSSGARVNRSRSCTSRRVSNRGQKRSGRSSSKSSSRIVKQPRVTRRSTSHTRREKLSKSDGQQGQSTMPAVSLQMDNVDSVKLEAASVGERVSENQCCSAVLYSYQTDSLLASEKNENSNALPTASSAPVWYEYTAAYKQQTSQPVESFEADSQQSGEDESVDDQVICGEELYLEPSGLLTQFPDSHVLIGSGDPTSIDDERRNSSSFSNQEDSIS